MGNGELWPPTESKPLHWLPKNCHSWLRPRGDPLCQFWCKSFDGGLLGKWVKYNVELFLHTYVRTCTYVGLYLFFFGEQPTGQTLRPILTRDDSKDAKSRKDVPFGGYKNWRWHLTPFQGPQTSILGEKTDFSKIFGWKSLTMGTPESKVPLIVIVAP